MSKGKFITFEGGESSGKTTQIKLIDEYLTQRGIDHIVFREPGGNPIAEEIRNLLFMPGSENMDVTCEALLFFAGRAQNMKDIIKPALDAGKWVISDRFIDSSYVYQGYAKGLGIKWLMEITKKVVTDDYMPDLTLLLDVPVEKALARHREEINRHDTAEAKFHEKIRYGYLTLCEKFPRRIMLVNGNKGIDEVHNAIVQHIEQMERTL